LGAPHLDFEMWESTNSRKLLHPVRALVGCFFDSPYYIFVILSERSESKDLRLLL